MPLKRNYASAQAVLSLMVLLLIFLGEGIVGYALIADGHVLGSGSSGAVFFVFFIITVLMMDAILLFIPFSYLVRAQSFATASRADMTAPAPIKLDPSLALRDGETIVMGRRKTTGSTIRDVIFAPFVCLLLVAASWMALIWTIPALNASALNPVNDVIGQESALPAVPLLDALALAIPVGLFGLLALLVPIYMLRQRRDRIVADDRGITANGKFIPWNDIHLFLMPFTRDTEVDGFYWVWGREHGINLIIHKQRELVPSGQRQMVNYRFTNGYEAYERDARRLLATITTRSYQPLRMSLWGSRTTQRLRRRFPVQSIVAVDAETSPLAAPEWQPPEHPIITNFDVRLQPRINVGRQMVMTLLGVIGMLLVYFLFTYLTFFSWNSSDIALDVVFLAFILSFVVPIAYMFALQRQRGQSPIIIADARGVTRFAFNAQGDSNTTIPWDEVRAWGVVPPRQGTQDSPRYVVIGRNAKITWNESATATLGGERRGDRRAAYVQCAAELHALIYARTGLPLHDLTSVVDPSMQSVSNTSAISVADMLR